MRRWIIGRWIPLSAILLGFVISVVAFARSAVRSEREYLGVVFDRLGSARQPARPIRLVKGDPIEVWSTIANEACAVDHTPVASGETRVFGEQLGPGRTARAMAMVHVGMFEALNAINPKYTSYAGIAPVPRGESTDERAAVAQAARDTLIALYPSQASTFTALLDEYLAGVPDRPAKTRGIELGKRCAAAIIDLRNNDGSDHREPLVGTEFPIIDQPGFWEPDPVTNVPIALGAFWGGVRPFALASASQFRAPPPPGLNTPEYTVAFEEVRLVGGDGIVTPTARTPEQTLIGIFWGYDGSSKLGTPPRLFNQITLTIARQTKTKGVDLARLLALTNVAMADAGIACWESKYFYNLWRPVTGIRDAHLDGNSVTMQDSTYTPLGAPASNTHGPNGTPPFPAYPSGHATFGGAVFQILRAFYGTDNIAFSFVSDELNGETKDVNGQVRPRVERSFQTLSRAEEENGQSRIYLGVHWAYDKTSGITMGRSIGDLVFAQNFKPLR